MKKFFSLLLCLSLLFVSSAALAEGEAPAVQPEWLELSADDTVLTVRIPLEDAVTCATLTPARMMGIADRVGSIEIGKRADLLIVKGEETLVGVISSGVLLNI